MVPNKWQAIIWTSGGLVCLFSLCRIHSLWASDSTIMTSARVDPVFAERVCASCISHTHPTPPHYPPSTPIPHTRLDPTEHISIIFYLKFKSYARNGFQIVLYKIYAIWSCPQCFKSTTSPWFLYAILYIPYHAAVVHIDPCINYAPDVAVKTSISCPRHI